MRGIPVLLLIIGVAACRALEEQCPTDWSIEKILRHEDCRKFYKCVFGEPVEHTCPDNLYFNQEILECDWPSNVHCDQSIDSGSTTSIDQFEPTTPAPDSAEVPVCEVEVWPEPDPPKGEVESLPNGCPVDPHISLLLPHPEDCSLFYFCVWGELVLSECPAALHFNRELQVCDLPAEAGCTVSANKHTEARRRLLDEILA